MNKEIETTFLVIGGGIAGVSCIETLSFYCENVSIVLLTESPLIKAVTNLVAVGKSLTRFDIEEKPATSLPANVTVIMQSLSSIDVKNRIATTDESVRIQFKMACICTGGRPKIIEQVNEQNRKFVLGIRDTESVIEFQKRIQNSQRIAVVGNGGIASELIYELKNIEIDWIIKDKFISQTFVDPGAAAFLQRRIEINSGRETSKTNEKPVLFKRMRYEEDSSTSKESPVRTKGAALGPDWHTLFTLTGKVKEIPKNVRIHVDTEIERIEIDAHNATSVHVQLKNDETIDCELIVSATGVVPQLSFSVFGGEFRFGPDGGIFVDEFMQTSVENIYAAGDVCFAGWEWAPHWFQMRLWTQARQMGAMAGKAMAAKLNSETIYPDFCFELFGHVTRLFGYQVVLLGNYNGQGLDKKYEALLRVSGNEEYIKYVLVDGKLQGAILIGDTGLEEMTENLILNQLDLTPYGDDILNPDIDIEDYFD